MTALIGRVTVNVAPRFSPALSACTLTAVQLDDVADDGEAEPDAGVLPRARAVSLAKPVEHIGQELGRDADPGVGDPDLHVVARSARAATSTRPAARM